MVACLFILQGHLLLGVVGFCDMTTLLPRHERGETPVQRTLYTSTTTSRKNLKLSTTGSHACVGSVADVVC